MTGVGADITGVEENNFEDEVSLNETYQDIQNNNYDVNDYENNEDNVYLPHQMPLEINIEEENKNEENNIDENEENNIDENVNNIDTLVEELEGSLDNEIEEKIIYVTMKIIIISMMMIIFNKKRKKKPKNILQN